LTESAIGDIIIQQNDFISYSDWGVNPALQLEGTLEEHIVRMLTLTFALSILLFISVSGKPYQAKSNFETPDLLASAPAPVSAGAGIAAVVGLVGAPIDSVFALRGGEMTDFWHYSISHNEWTVLPGAPAPVGEGGGIVEVFSHVFCKPGRFYVAALRGGNTTDFWTFNIEQNRWCEWSSTPAPVGPGGAIAQLQRIGEIYVLRGNGTTDFWRLKDSQWKALKSTPGPVGAGGGLVGINYGTRSQKDVLYALQGGGSTAVWKYDVDTDSWTHQSDVPGPVGAGGAITSPNFGDEGTLSVLQGGGVTSVWSLDIAGNSWKLMADAPGAITTGGALSNQVNGCDFAFVGHGSNQFFSTGLWPCVTDGPRFSMSFAQPTITIGRGTKIKVKLNIIRVGGFTGNVRIIPPETVPAGIKLPEDLATLTGDLRTFKIKVKGGTPTGTHELIFTGRDDAGKSITATLTLIVQ
jgi:hypothetical protein